MTTCNNSPPPNKQQAKTNKQTKNNNNSIAIVVHGLHGTAIGSKYIEESDGLGFRIMSTDHTIGTTPVALGKEVGVLAQLVLLTTYA